ncbi:substrate-binding periplasmic protein [Alkalimarinus coralli]|uniref:substrate-binding periplasmic protein n=1 Tax=Alkalimarinus coralli TaxID=2935863 RepID=UPI00202B468F|nr:transporter substrate-binding domain-containing protein [Alkalimarinus coralli]
MDIAKCHRVFKKALLTLSLSTCILPVASAEDKTLLKISAIDWCPQICAQDSENPGYLVEILQNLFKDSPYIFDIKIYPWSRAISLVRFGSAQALLSPSKEEAPDLYYHQVPLSYQVHCFFKSADDSWVYKSDDSLLSKKIIIYQDHSYGNILKEYLSAERNGMFLLPYNDGYIEQAINLVRAKRADTFLFTLNSVTHYLINNKITDIKRDTCIKKDELWLALSPMHTGLNKQVTEFLDRKLVGFIKTKEYRAILKKYHVSFPDLNPQG